MRWNNLVSGTTAALSAIVLFASVSAAQPVGSTFIWNGGAGTWSDVTKWRVNNEQPQRHPKTGDILVIDAGANTNEVTIDGAVPMGDLDGLKSLHLIKGILASAHDAELKIVTTDDLKTDADTIVRSKGGQGLTLKSTGGVVTIAGTAKSGEPAAGQRAGDVFIQSDRPEQDGIVVLGTVTPAQSKGGNGAKMTLKSRANISVSGVVKAGAGASDTQLPSHGGTTIVECKDLNVSGAIRGGENGRSQSHSGNGGGVTIAIEGNLKVKNGGALGGASALPPTGGTGVSAVGGNGGEVDIGVRTGDMIIEVGGRVYSGDGASLDVGGNSNASRTPGHGANIIINAKSLTIERGSGPAGRIEAGDGGDGHGTPNRTPAGLGGNIDIVLSSEGGLVNDGFIVAGEGGRGRIRLTMYADGGKGGYVRIEAKKAKAQSSLAIIRAGNGGAGRHGGAGGYVHLGAAAGDDLTDNLKGLVRGGDGGRGEIEIPNNQPPPKGGLGGDVKVNGVSKGLVGGKGGVHYYAGRGGADPAGVQNKHGSVEIRMRDLASLGENDRFEGDTVAIVVDAGGIIRLDRGFAGELPLILADESITLDIGCGGVLDASAWRPGDAPVFICDPDSLGTSAVMHAPRESQIVMGTSAMFQDMVIANEVRFDQGCASESLTTLFTSNNGFAGNMFDLKALRADVDVDAWDVNVTLPGQLVRISVYWREDSFVNGFGTPVGWNHLGTAEVVSAGEFLPTRVPIGGLVLPMGLEIGIYIFVTDYTTQPAPPGIPTMRYTNIPPALDLYSNLDLELFGGYGKGVPPFTGGTFGFRMWNGTVRYRVRCIADCDPSTGRGVVDIFDFLCFGNRFLAGDPYACNMDTSTGPGVCDIFDFLMFGNFFNAGCP